MNHTGTISTSEVWDVSSGDHHITGTITIAANVSLTWAPGTKIYNDASWVISLNAGTSGFTSFSAVGTSILPITYARSTTGMNNSAAIFGTLPNNSIFNLQYIRFDSSSGIINIGSPTNSTVTFNNIYIRDAFSHFVQIGDSFSGEVSFSNCYFDRVGANGTSSAAFLLGTSNISAGIINFNDCYFNPCPVLRGTVISGAGHTLTFNDCYFQEPQFVASVAAIPNYTYNFNRCVLYNMVTFSNGSTVTNPYTINNSIISRSGFTAQTLSLNSNTFNNCDVGNCTTNNTAAFNNANISGSNTVTLSGCYVVGYKFGDSRYYSTANQVTGTIAICGERTTPNFPFTQESITATSITTSSVIISWVGLFRTRNRIRYGTTSGYYPMSLEIYGTWDNWDGKGQLATSPSFTLSNLQSGTTYYYVCESLNWAYNDWVVSTEQTFTTLNNQPSYAFVG
jgi:hypothetical protein